MGIFAVGITFALLLFGISMLFVKRRRLDKPDWPARAAIASVIAALTFLVWVRQYFKFVDNHGFLYEISPTYGLVIFTTLAIVGFVLLVRMAWKEGQ